MSSIKDDLHNRQFHETWLIYYIKPINLGTNVGLNMLLNINSWSYHNRDAFFFLLDGWAKCELENV